MDRRARARRDAEIVATLLGGSTQAATAREFSVSERTVRAKWRDWRDGRIELQRASSEVLEREAIRTRLAAKALDEAAIGVTRFAVKASLFNRRNRVSDAHVKLAVAYKRRHRPVELPSPHLVDLIRELNGSHRRLLARLGVDRHGVEAVIDETMRVFDRFGGEEYGAR